MAKSPETRRLTAPPLQCAHPNHALSRTHTASHPVIGIIPRCVSPADLDEVDVVHKEANAERGQEGGGRPHAHEEGHAAEEGPRRDRAVAHVDVVLQRVRVEVRHQAHELGVGRERGERAVIASAWRREMHALTDG